MLLSLKTTDFLEYLQTKWHDAWVSFEIIRCLWVCGDLGDRWNKISHGLILVGSCELVHVGPCIQSFYIGVYLKVSVIKCFWKHSPQTQPRKEAEVTWKTWLTSHEARQGLGKGAELGLPRRERVWGLLGTDQQFSCCFMAYPLRTGCWNSKVRQREPLRETPLQGGGHLRRAPHTKRIVG